MRYEAAVSCHIGRIRKNNEDNFYLNGQIRRDLNTEVCTLNTHGPARKALFAVADGMGGEANGEIASCVTVSCLQPAALADIKEQSLKSIRQANAQVCQQIRESACGSMGSTLAALYIDANTAVGCNVGDSRIYLYRSRHLRLLSTDHTTAQMLVNMGMLTPEQAKHHPGRRALRQHIGIFEEEMTISPSYTDEIALQDGDVFLICSDGLTDMVDDPHICPILDGGGSAEEIAGALVQKALDQGGKDNVTAMIVKIQDKNWFDRFIPGKRCHNGI